MKYVQEQIQTARGGAIMDDDSSSDESEEEVCDRWFRGGCRADGQGEFYTEGSDDLLLARKKLARYSLTR